MSQFLIAVHRFVMERAVRLFGADIRSPAVEKFCTELDAALEAFWDKRPANLVVGDLEEEQ